MAVDARALVEVSAPLEGLLVQVAQETSVIDVALVLRDRSQSVERGVRFELARTVAAPVAERDQVAHEVQELLLAGEQVGQTGGHHGQRGAAVVFEVRALVAHLLVVP